MNYSLDNDTSITLTQRSLWNRALSFSRSLFYMLSPSETSFAKVEDVPNYVNIVS